MDLDWTKFAAMATVVGAAATLAASGVVIITAVIYGFQLRAMKKSRELEAMLQILRYLDDPHSSRGRWFAYEHINEINPLLDDSDFWGSRARVRNKIEALSNGRISLAEMEEAVSVLNHIAILIEEGHAPSSIVNNHLKTTFLRGWEVFEPYVTHSRRSRSDVSKVPSNYGRHFENMVKRFSEKRGSWWRWHF